MEMFTFTFRTFERIHKALAMIESGEIDDLSFGRHDLADGIYVNVVEIETKDAAPFESHHQYADIHYPIVGSEQIALADEAAMEITQVYNEKDDVLFGKASGERYTVKEKHPFVVMPGEAHVPGLCDGEKRKIKKAIVKVLV